VVLLDGVVVAHHWRFFGGIKTYIGD